VKEEQLTVNEKGQKRLNFLLENRAENSVHRYFENGDYKDDEFAMSLIPVIKENLIFKIAEYDPSNNKKYTQWLLREYAKKRFNFKTKKQKIHNVIKQFEAFSHVFKKQDIYAYSLLNLIKEVKFLESLPHEAKLSNRAFNKWFKEYLISAKKITRACKPNCVNAHSLKFPEKENHYEQHRPRKTQSHGR
jgi:hypothetical protein